MSIVEKFDERVALLELPRANIEVIESEVRMFKRRFLGICGREGIKSRTETLEILKDMYGEDNIYGWKSVLNDIDGKLIKYGERNYFVLKKEEGISGEFYRMETFLKI